MKATAHWLELKGHREKSHSMIFDEIFSEQVFETGKIEDGRVIKSFFKRTNQPLMQDWMVQMVKNLVGKLPISLLTRMGLATLVRPRTRNWDRARDAIRDYVDEQKQREKAALGLNELVAQAAAEARSAGAKQEGANV